MTETSEGRLGRRLKRILLLLPYAIRHPGVTVDELSRKFGVRRRDLIEDLQLVFLCGLPGYGPGDLIDVSIESERVFVRMADYFAAPLRLTPAEALALYAGGAAMAALPGMEEAGALRSALAKLGRALGAQGDEPEEAGIRLEMQPGAARHLEVIQRALAEGRQMDIEYYSASRSELIERTVEPWGLIAALGHWYLIAWDHSSGDERMFRTDRIKAASLSEAEVSAPADFDPSRYRGAFVARDDEELMSLEVSPQAARWVEEYYPLRASEELPDGWKRITLASSSRRWAALLAVRLGADARAVSPPAVLDEARALAATIAARHETSEPAR